MSVYRVPSPPPGPPHPKPRRFRVVRTIAPLQSLPFGIAGYLFIAALVAFAFRAAIHLRLRMPSGEIGIHPASPGIGSIEPPPADSVDP